jgi:hypothetical protein
MFILRQSTAVDVLIGPFVDGTDGVTTEEAVSPSVQLSKNGQTAATKNEATTPAHDNAGYYNCMFDATDTGTVGTLVAFIEGTTATFLQVRHEFQIMDTAAFDALFADGAEGPLQATTVGNTLDVSATGEAGLDWANIGSPTTAQNLSATNIDVDQIVASVSGNVDGNVTGSVGSISGITFPTNFSDLAITITTGLVSVGTNNDKTGYSLTQSFPTNFADMSITVTTGLVDITQAAADKAWSTATRILTASTNFNDVAATDIVTAGAITTSSGAVSNVTLAATTTDVTNDVGITQAAADKVWGTTVRVVSAATNITSTGTTTFTQTGDSFVRLGAPVGASVSADILEIEAQTRKIKKNEAFSDLTFLMVDSTTKDPATGLTITEEVSKDGAAFAAATGTAAEISDGIYQMDASAADMNADVLIFRFFATGADDTFVTIVTKP